MKKEILILAFFLVFFALPLASAEIIINKQPQEIYNFGDVISVPITISTSSRISGFFNMDLLCGGAPINFFRNTVSLSVGEERRMDSSLALIKEVIGNSSGFCRIKAYMSNVYVLTNEFKISERINVDAEISSSDFNPGESLFIEGRARKENGDDSNGFVEVLIADGNSTILNQTESVRNGFFSFNLSFDNEMKAGQYSLNLNVYETDPSGEKTNKGFLSRNIRINQIPRSFEIFFDSDEVEPGTSLKVKTILYDQSGEKIASNSTISIFNEKNQLVERAEKATDEFFEFPIRQDEPPSEWRVSAVSGNFSREKSFKIMEKENISIEIINTTLIITNVGNVYYNKPALVKIGNNSLPLNVSLDVGKGQEYILTAPDGEYRVEVITDDSSISGNVVLTGNAIDIKKASMKFVFMQRPFVWVFMIFILGFGAFVVFKKGYKRTFIGYIGSKISKGKSSDSDVKSLFNLSLSPKDSLINLRDRAELSLSIKGEKQEVNVVALQIKNFSEVISKKEGVKDSFNKISEVAEKHKAVVNESSGFIFFILSPKRTKTFKNEKSALNIAQNIKEILRNHNKMFKQKINFGISLVSGEIVVKADNNSFKFMALGSLMTNAKKISSIADDDILLSEKMNELLLSYLKTNKVEKVGVVAYSIKDTKNPEEHKKFLAKFLERQEKN